MFDNSLFCDVFDTWKRETYENSELKISRLRISTQIIHTDSQPWSNVNKGIKKKGLELENGCRTELGLDIEA
jgi:hypothetical protein